MKKAIIIILILSLLLLSGCDLSKKLCNDKQKESFDNYTYYYDKSIAYCIQNVPIQNESKSLVVINCNNWWSEIHIKAYSLKTKEKIDEDIELQSMYDRIGDYCKVNVYEIKKDKEVEL